VFSVQGALPFFLYIAVSCCSSSWWSRWRPSGRPTRSPSRSTGRPTPSWRSPDGAYRRAYVGSLRLSLITATVGAVLGLALAVAVLGSQGTLLRRFVLTAAGVLANFGGVPLAFAFLATIGNAGVVTALLTDTLGLGGFSLYSLAGLALVYLYFLIPADGLDYHAGPGGPAPAVVGGCGQPRRQRLAVLALRRGPVLASPVIGATMLLFASAFAAFATARALVGSSIPLVTLQIADALLSNVVVGSENLGKALALGMVVLIGLVMAFYIWVQRRTQRWLS
jgi:putative spermidine/putrescine transport system permease protein